MSYAAHAARYKEAEVVSASPGQLVVITYDHLLLNLQRARVALERGEIEQRCVALDRARQAIAELLVTLDRERGGDLAANLSSVYAFALAQLVDVRDAGDIPRINRVARMFDELRVAFAAARQQVRAGAA